LTGKSNKKFAREAWMKTAWGTLIVTAVLALAFAGTARAGSSYAVGDVFLGVSNGTVNEYTPTGTLVQTMSTGLGGYTTGMGFDASGNLYVTDFSYGDITQFNNSGTVTNATFISGQSSPESLAFDNAGNIYVGDASLDLINEYNSSGTLIASTTAATENRGTDWIDLASDQQTILYTSEGTSILSVNAATDTQNTDFATGLTGANAYALRIIPTGADAGDVLVADSSNALLIGTDGSLLTTYTLPGNGGGDFALNIDPNGTDFWTADFLTGDVWEVNILTGAIDEAWNSGTGGSTVFGLVVFGQQTASGGGGGTVATPEPGTLSLLGLGIFGLAGIKRKFA
jgi:PEP-CTERM motif